MIEFLKDWQAYRAGATVDPAVLGGGVVDTLAKRGIVRDITPAVMGDTVIAAPPMAAKKTFKPKSARR